MQILCFLFYIIRLISTEIYYILAPINVEVQLWENLLKFISILNTIHKRDSSLIEIRKLMETSLPEYITSNLINCCNHGVQEILKVGCSVLDETLCYTDASFFPLKFIQ